MNKFIDHYDKYYRDYDEAEDYNLITGQDLDIALNRDGKYTYEEEKAAQGRIETAMKAFADKNPEDKTLSALMKSFPTEDKKNVSTPNTEDWQTNDAKEMDKLADQMKFRWSNAQDRQQMIKELSDVDLKKAREEAVNEDYSYLGMDKDNPINKGLNWLADKIISEDTKKAIIEDPSNTSRIAGNAAVDIVGNAADFMPGVGGYVVGPAIRAGRDIAEGKDASTIATNAGKDLAVNAVVGAGLKGIGGIADDVPFFKGIARKLKDRVGKWEDIIEKSEKDIPNATPPHPTKTKTEMQNFVDDLPAHERSAYDDVLKDGNWKKKEAVEAAHEKAKSEIGKLRNERKEAQRLVNSNKGKAYTTVVFGRTAQGSARVAGHNTMPAQTKKPTIEELYGDPELQSYIRLRKRGYSPKIPDKFKEYKEALDADIFDFNKNLRGE